ncbi:hypothetical protein [Massilimicrobiota timonensis]|uniref:Capsular biosynthesis protein n=1 Tax=Massilimicrobiota timonensis TaxID=1776392 RepID=A0A1Y4SW79_9FIRM|nr:hypothetical protein [Massilimicrobiota timonensis]OUQ33211.1 hypothetical protein B5E75_11125 [Massilimicrobiota timonensis]
MSKICFISVGNLYTIPYIKVYEEIIEEDFDIIYWNRDNIMENTRAKRKFVLDKKVNNYFDKICGYLKFARLSYKTIKNEKYESVIFLSTIAAVLNYKTIKKLTAQYIIDIRDYTFENNKLFKNLEDKIFKKAKIIIISSPAYRCFLPRHYHYYELHNVQNINPDKIPTLKNKNQKKVLSYIGTISYIDENKKIIDYFANDERFILKFIGKNSEILKEYCKRKNINNVFFIGKFKPDQILDLYSGTDVIINAYGNNNPRLDYALSNKLYFATKLYLPIIVSKNTYMEKVTADLGIGLVFNNNLKDQILSFKMDDNKKEILDNFNKKIIKINKETREIIRECVAKDAKTY